MSDFISNINIKSFRGIKDLELNDLLPINILTGDNNSGKTSVLEVLQSFENPGDFRLWRLLIRRDRMTSIRGMSFYEGFYDLFDINSAEKKLEYTAEINGTNNHVVVYASEIEEEMTAEEYMMLQGMTIAREDKEENLEYIMQSVSKLNMEIEIDGKMTEKDSVYEGQFYKASSPENSKQKLRNIVYISPTRHAEGDIFLSQVLNNPELYEQMLLVLREFDEDIISINFDKSRVAGRGVYKILSKSHQKALPLNVYGDGMKKAVLLMSAVIAAKDGVLLLDEFETAIHTSAMNKTFKWILETCVKLNVQVFLTSHSKEAIDKVLKCSPDLTDKIALYTLYKDDEGTSSRRLAGKKAIEVQDEMGLELR